VGAARAGGGDEKKKSRPKHRTNKQNVWLVCRSQQSRQAWGGGKKKVTFQTEEKGAAKI